MNYMQAEIDGFTFDPNPIDDGVKCCPDCERPNQFGELCNSCREEREWEDICERCDDEYQDTPSGF